MAPPVLWQYTISNFSEKARWALDFRGIPHERRTLVPGFPRAMLFSLRRTVPVLDLNGERIVDSTRIVEALERLRPEPPLYPEDPAERRRALELEDFFDEEAGHEMRRAVFHTFRDDHEYAAALLSWGLKPATARAFRAMFALPGSMAYARRRYRIYPADAEAAIGKLEAALDRIASEAGPEGYLVGSRFTIADLTAAALLYPLVWPGEFPYDLPRPPSLGPLEPLTKHPACEWIAETYRRHRGTSAEIRA